MHGYNRVREPACGSAYTCRREDTCDVSRVTKLRFHPRLSGEPISDSPLDQQYINLDQGWHALILHPCGISQKQVTDMYESIWEVFLNFVEKT